MNLSEMAPSIDERKVYLVSGSRKGVHFYLNQSIFLYNNTLRKSALKWSI